MVPLMCRVQFSSFAKDDDLSDTLLLTYLLTYLLNFSPTCWRFSGPV